MTNELFKKALNFVLRWEGGFSNNPHDLGGATNKGITQNTYNAWRKSKGLPPQDVIKITDDEVEKIYFERYWTPAGCSKMSGKFAVLVFDTVVNMGLSRANEFLKAAEWKHPEKFIQARETKYREFAKYGNQKIFLKGWLNRLEALDIFVKTI